MELFYRLQKTLLKSWTSQEVVSRKGHLWVRGLQVCSRQLPTPVLRKQMAPDLGWSLKTRVSQQKGK